MLNWKLLNDEKADIKIIYFQLIFLKKDFNDLNFILYKYILKIFLLVQ